MTQESYPLRNPIPIPARISALIIDPIQGQITFIGNAQQVLVGIYQGGCDVPSSTGSYEGHNVVYCDASLKELGPGAEK